jgi:chromosome segregation ATPase
MATIGKYKGTLGRGSQREDDLKKIVASYEAKLAHARAEVADLRKALQGLQEEHRALINKQVQALTAQGLAAL